ncbi:MAG: Nif3-like dinuclear metal center hexameric protein [Propioniciclava sp.]|uniref:Nif3-like dinuclear metal center hexameric protein n=1 Tax=Propioniciclava sp. TaxID=2038686 RepID=UPI0039E305C6
MGVRVATLAGWFEDAYPPGLAEGWDQVGLSVGDPDASVDRVLFAVDVTDAVVAEAIAAGAQLIVSHHPLLLRGVHAVRTDQPKGRVVATLLRAGISVFSAHTNADAAADGVADALADACGLVDRRPLVPSASEPALGLGRIGRLPEPITADAFARRLAASVPGTAGGVKLGGDPGRLLSTVAVLGGAGDSLLDTARAAEVDCYVTGDLRHHPAQDFLAHADAPALVDVPHWAAEWLWLPRAEAYLRRTASAAGVDLATSVSTLVTDPWVARY